MGIFPNWNHRFDFSPGGLIGILATVFWVLMLVDIAQRKFKDDNAKIVWLVIVLLLNVPGAIVYWFFGRSQGTRG